MAAATRGGGTTVALDDALTNDFMDMVGSTAVRAWRGWRSELFAVRLAKWLAKRLAVGLAVDITLVIFVSGPRRRGGVADKRAGLRTTVKNLASWPAIIAFSLVDSDSLKVAGQLVGVARLLIGRTAAVVVDVALIVAIALLDFGAAAATAHVKAVVLDDSVSLYIAAASSTAIATSIAITVIFAVTFVVAILETVLLVTVATAHVGQRESV